MGAYVRPNLEWRLLAASTSPCYSFDVGAARQAFLWASSRRCSSSFCALCHRLCRMKRFEDDKQLQLLQKWTRRHPNVLVEQSGEPLRHAIPACRRAQLSRLRDAIVRTPGIAGLATSQSHARRSRQAPPQTRRACRYARLPFERARDRPRASSPRREPAR